MRPRVRSLRPEPTSCKRMRCRRHAGEESVSVQAEGSSVLTPHAPFLLGTNSAVTIAF